MDATYGTVKPSVIVPANDAEIFYHYRPSRSTDDPQFSNFKRIDDVSSMLVRQEVDTASATFTDRLLPGMYRLNLPLDKFGRKGVYTIYIKPKEHRTVIRDVGILAAYPNIRGIVLRSEDLDFNSSITADSLVGYRVEYFDTNGERQGYYRIVTSNNRAEAVTESITSTHQNSSAYRYTDGGGLHFLTLTPSTAPDFKANATPYIGAPSQTICLTNTKFDPVMVEVEMVDHDIETLSIMMEGEQVRNLGTGRVTHYNFDGEIYKQYEFSTVKDNYTATNIAELKLDKSSNIDNSLSLEALKES